MKVLCDLVIAVEALVEVSFAIAVQVAQNHKLIAAGDEDLAIDNLDAERLKEARGDALPGQGVVSAGG